MLPTLASRRVDEMFAVLVTMAENLLGAHDDVPRDAAGFIAHREDFARGRISAEAMVALVRSEYAALVRALDAGELTTDDVARVRHDLRAQIQAVKGYAEMALEEMQALGDASLLLRASFARIVDAASRTIPHVDRIQFSSLVPKDHYATSFERRSHELLEGTVEPEVRYEERYRGCRVVLIDDSAPNRDVLSRKLRRVGLDVRVAATGEEGLALLAKEPAHLVLCDVIMPGMDGYEVLRRLKSQDALRDIPVLMISALREDETIVRCIEAGADDYLPTPLRSTILHARIKACLNRKLLADQDREHAEALAEAREELVSAIESMSDGFAIWGSDDRIRIFNEAFRQLYPFLDALAPAFSLAQFTRARLDAAGVEAAEASVELARAIAHHRSPEPVLFHLAEGRTIEVSSHTTPHDAVVSVHKDVTSRKRDEDHLRYLAMHDPLTGLANRTTFDARLAEAVRDRPSFALLFVDLDRFKDVNDTLGHDAGDRLLMRVADAIRTVVRTGDLVARVGGDEFAVLLLEAFDATAVAQIASRVLQGIGTTYTDTDGSATVSYGATIGIAVHPEHSGSPPSAETLLQHADIAMYAAKRQGRGRHAFYQPHRLPDVG